MQRTDSSRHATGRPGVPGSAGRGPGAAPPAPHSTGCAGENPAAAAARGTTVRLQSLSLGIAALGGAWQAAASDLAAWIRVSDVLYALSGLLWLVLLVRYLLHRGNRLRHLRTDLRHPGQGFAPAYVPIVGMLGAGGAVTTAAVHPGFLLPVVSAPFIASATTDALALPSLGWACFAVGVFSWLSVGTVVLGRLMTGGSLTEQARPTLTVLVIRPRPAASPGWWRTTGASTPSGTP